MRIHPNAISARRVDVGDQARAGHEVFRRVLGVDPALDGVALDDHILLAHAEFFPRGNADLLFDQVHSGHHLGHRVLHLDSGVHFHKIEIFVFVQQKLDGSRVFVSHGLGRTDRRIAHALPQVLGDHVAGGLLQHLLVAALNGTVPLSQMNHVAVLIRHNLELDVAGLLDVFLNIHGVVGKSLYGLHLGRVEVLREIRLAPGDTHALAAAAGGRLDHHRKADGFGHLQGLCGLVNRLLAAGHHGHARIHHGAAGLGLVPHPVNDLSGRPDEGDVALRAELGELGVFRQKAKTRMDGVGL